MDHPQGFSSLAAKNWRAQFYPADASHPVAPFTVGVVRRRSSSSALARTTTGAQERLTTTDPHAKVEALAVQCTGCRARDRARDLISGREAISRRTRTGGLLGWIRSTREISNSRRGRRCKPKVPGSRSHRLSP